MISAHQGINLVHYHQHLKCGERGGVTGGGLAVAVGVGGHGQLGFASGSISCSAGSRERGALRSIRVWVLGL